MHHLMGLSLALWAVTATGAPHWIPFPTDGASTSPEAVTCAGLLERPAGARGPIRIRAGHLVRGDGTRWRIWGVNLTGAACFPDPEDGVRLAARLARLGVNCVRFHFLDSAWGPAASLFVPDRNDTQALAPRQLARLDRFVAALKTVGIYSNFNLNVGRVYRSGDQVRDHRLLGLGKAVCYFDPRIQELHRDYARLLLTHVNPHTGHAYTHEPALALVELVNENSIVESWFSGRLRGRQTTPTTTTWTDIPPSYAADLTRRYNAWLARTLSPADLAALRRRLGLAAGVPIPRLQPQDFAGADPQRFAAEARYYMSLEASTFRMMRDFIRRDLQCETLIAATSDHNHGRSGLPLLRSTAELDIVDGHVYWQHPSYLRDPNGRSHGFRIPNTPMVADPAWSTVAQLARSRVAAKPYTVSETNHPFPSEYACEGIPILAAYALFQDWDGIFFYTFSHSNAGSPRRPSHFDIGADPAKVVQLAALAPAFHRGDLAPARVTIPRTYDTHQVITSLHLDSRTHGPFFTPGYDARLSLVHATAITAFDHTGGAYPAAPASERLVADTGQLTWTDRGRDGVVTVDSPRTQALIGSTASLADARTTHLRVACRTAFAAFVLTSLDGLPLSRSRRMLLTATARSALTDMTWNAERTSLTNWGQPPMRVEVVQARVTLAGLDRPAVLRLRALDGSGTPGPEVPLRREADGAVTVPLGDPAALWFLLDRP